MMSYHTPIPSDLYATGRRNSLIMLMASIRISMRLVINAINGANGKAATNIVTNPYWITTRKEQERKVYLTCAITVFLLRLLTPAARGGGSIMTAWEQI